jgi:lipopolysaccharide/colanic/teichoic acid biosynthesis glycosyltransferase
MELREVQRRQTAEISPAVSSANLPYMMQSVGSRAFYEVWKRAIDIVTSALLLLLFAPLFVIVAIAVKLSSPGPIFFRHKRLGRGGKEFWCVKFRTMVVDAEAQLERDPALRQRFQERFKLKNDPRVTPLGAFLRKTSLDELPQLLLVLRGDMTLIGPRPIVRAEIDKYGIYHEKLLSVKPGLSGMWQAFGRSDISYEERIQMDLHYIEHRCLRLDLMLLYQTPISILARRGAC